MPLGEDDLRFKLTVDPDTAKMQESIKDIGKEIDKQAQQAKASWDALGKSGASQLESIRANQKITEGFAAPKLSEAIDVRAEQMGRVTAEMQKQKELLERINVELDPKVLRERVALEKQLSDARAEYVKAHGEEAKSQGIGGNVGSDILGALKQGVGPAIAKTLEIVGEALGPVGIALSGVAIGAKVAVGELERLANAIAHFAGVASPGSLKQWELVVRDLQGVIGQRMVPILGAMTSGLRDLADGLDAVLPSVAHIQALTSAMGGFFKGITLGVASIPNAENFLKGLLQGLTFGIFGTGSGKSTGAAARPGGIRTGDEYQRINIESALNSFSGQTVPQKQLTVLEQIRDLMLRGRTNQAKDLAYKAAGQTAGDVHGINRALMGF